MLTPATTSVTNTNVPPHRKNIQDSITSTLTIIIIKRQSTEEFDSRTKHSGCHHWYKYLELFPDRVANT